MSTFIYGFAAGSFVGCWLVYFAHDWIWRSREDAAPSHHTKEETP